MASPDPDPSMTLQPKFTPHLQRLDLAALLALLLINLVWLSALAFPFLDLDDNLYITGNPAILHGLSWQTFSWAFTNSNAEFWLPLTWLSLALDSTLFGTHAWGYHLTNILFHVANTLLLYLLFRKICGGIGKSLFAAALFAVHPQRIESVVWATERKDVLAVFFGLLTLLAYVRYARSKNFPRYFLVCLLFLCGLMSKPMLVTLPLILLLLDYWPLNRLDRFTFTTLWPLLKEKIPLFAFSAGISIDTLLMRAAGGSPDSPLLVRLSNMVLSYSLYIRDFFYTGFLSLAYLPRTNIPMWIIVALLVAFFLINAFLFLQLRRKKNFAKPLLIGWLWFLISLFPMSGIIQSGSIIRADRFSYFPIIGILIMLIWGIAPAISLHRLPRSLLALAACAILIFSIVGTWQRLSLWREPLQLYEHDLAQDDNNFYLHMIAGFACEERNLDDRALAHFKRAAELEPDAARIYRREASNIFKRHLAAAASQNHPNTIPAPIR